MMLPREGYVPYEKFVFVRQFSQTLQAHKLSMIKRDKLARHPRTIWRIWACDVTPTSRIGRVRSANICGGRKLHQYVSTNVWTMKNVSTQQMSRSVRYMTLQSGTVALRWLFSCWNKHGRLSRDQSPSGHVRSQAISCLANRSYHAYVLMH